MLTNGWTGWFVASVLGILLAAVALSGDEASSSQSQVLDLRGRLIEPLIARDAVATVFLFTRTDCPISNRYAPEVRRLHKKFASRGVTFWLVYPEVDESGEVIRKHVKEYEYDWGVLRDPQHNLVKLTGVRVTPEAAVFVPEAAGSRMVYRGRIDDRVVAFGKTRPAPTARDLELILDEILKGGSVTSITTPAIGCFISDLQ